MASKNYYLLKIWELGTTDLVQERVLFLYEKNISEIKIATGYRATIEETKEPKETGSNKDKTTGTKAHTSRSSS